MDIWTCAVVLHVLSSVSFLSHDVTYNLIRGPRRIDCGIWLYGRAVEAASQEHNGCEMYVFRVWHKTLWFCSGQTSTQNFHYSICTSSYPPYSYCAEKQKRDLKTPCLADWRWIRMFNSASTKVHRTRSWANSLRLRCYLQGKCMYLGRVPNINFLSASKTIVRRCHLCHVCDFYRQ